MSAPGSYADRVKQRADMLGIVSKYTRLRRAGRQFVGLCPLHRERHPSFYVQPEKKVFYCFGCGTGGDLFRLVMLSERVSFSEAVEIVARVSGGGRRPQRFLLGPEAGGEAPSAFRRKAATHSPRERAVVQPADLARPCEPETVARPLFINERITGHE